MPILRRAHQEKPTRNDSKDKIGAVNFATIGNFSLFQSKQVWEEGKKKIDLNPALRVAFLDECDHVLLDEETQFNYSDSTIEHVYNFDEWVYRLAYDFYLDRKDSFPKEAGGVLKYSVIKI